jgi:hypothetical protein
MRSRIYIELPLNQKDQRYKIKVDGLYIVVSIKV